MIREVPHTSGMRVRMLRVLLGFSREDFCLKHSLNINTLTSIELNRLSISPKQLTRLTQAFRKEGIRISDTWIVDTESTDSLFLKSSEMLALEELANLPEKKRTIGAFVETNHFSPLYNKGDFVCGFWENDQNAFLGDFCMAQDAETTFIGILEKKEIGFCLRNPLNNEIKALSKKALIARILYHIRKPLTPEIIFYLEKAFSEDLLYSLAYSGATQAL